MTTRTAKASTGTSHEQDVLDAQLAFEQELLVGATIDILNSLADESGVTQRKLAKRLGITEGRVSQILSGSENISLKKLAALGWSLGIRFEVVPFGLEDRRGTPAVDDPGPPNWLERLRRQLLRRRHKGAEAID